ncbi:MAG: hypothetical protein IPL28_08015 [Chloroflexi bacterium]|nr:hypothetical protein [Chloroflexota bacterium]
MATPEEDEELEGFAFDLLGDDTASALTDQADDSWLELLGGANSSSLPADDMDDLEGWLNEPAPKTISETADDLDWLGGAAVASTADELPDWLGTPCSGRNNNRN